MLPTYWHNDFTFTYNWQLKDDKQYQLSVCWWPVHCGDRRRRGLPVSGQGSTSSPSQCESLSYFPSCSASSPPLITYIHTYTRLTALCPGLPGWAGTRMVKPIWILLKQETVSGSGISWAICKSAPRSRQITTPAPHNSVFYRPDALPAAQPTASKHRRQ